MKAIKLRPWDSAEHLKTEEEMDLYLEACLEEGDAALIAHALGVIAKARGMTLLEVMVALAVFAIAGLAVMKTASEHLSGLNYLEQKTLATWVVENQLVQQKLEGKWPGDSWVEGDEEMAGQTWYWRYRGVATADSNFRALDMEVRTAPKADSPVAMIRTYLSR